MDCGLQLLMTDLPHLMEPQQVHFFLLCSADCTEQLPFNSSENNVLMSPLGLLTQKMLIPGPGPGPGAWDSAFPASQGITCVCSSLTTRGEAGA